MDVELVARTLLPGQLNPVLALRHSHVRQNLPLLPFAIEQIDLGAAELVIRTATWWPKM